MCGIVGVFEPRGRTVEKTDIERQLKMIRYRGPDDYGIYVDDNMALGHVRLSIQDLSPLAAQPMVSHDGNYVLAYNGEVYNVKELQDDLRQKGVALRSTGDTEALLEYLIQFGVERTLNKIEGMFAFVLWDKTKKTVTFARDRHGIKPLYYRLGPGGQVHFASEMKSLAHPDYQPDLCTLNATLMGLGATWGEPTVFQNVKHVCAGEWMVFSEQGLVQRSIYFHINDFISEQMHRDLNGYSTSGMVDYVRDQIVLSTKRRLLSDAPVCAFVSGGVDSSLISAVSKKSYPNLKLYHCNVNSASETQSAERLADELDLEMVSVSVSDQDILSNTAIATWHYEAPLFYHNGSCVPFYLLSRRASQDGIKVVLTGEGSDEYFLGYPRFAIRPYILALQKMGQGVQNCFHKIPRMGEFLWQKKELLPSEQLRHLMFRYELQTRREDAGERLGFIRNKTERDFRVMCIDMVIGNVRTLLQRNDRLGMAGHLESRFPFLGHNMAQLAINLPNKYKIRKVLRTGDWRHAFLSDKWIVREVASKYLSRQLAFRRKFGFQSPVYRRLKIDPDFYKDGFLQQYYGINKNAMTRLLQSSPERWKANIFCLEIWGRVFPMQFGVDAIQERISQYAQIIQ